MYWDNTREWDSLVLDPVLRWGSSELGSWWVLGECLMWC